MPDLEPIEDQSLSTRLQRLGEVQPPLLLARRAVARHRVKRRLWRAAAAVVVGTGLGLWLADRPANLEAEAVHPPAVEAAGPTVNVLARLDTNELVAASGLFETALVQKRSSPKMLSASNAARIAGLEERLAVIDVALAATPARDDELLERQLWLGRLRTLDDMIETYERQDLDDEPMVLASF